MSRPTGTCSLTCQIHLRHSTSGDCETPRAFELRSWTLESAGSDARKGPLEDHRAARPFGAVAHAPNPLGRLGAAPWSLRPSLRTPCVASEASSAYARISIPNPRPDLAIMWISRIRPSPSRYRGVRDAPIGLWGARITVSREPSDTSSRSRTHPVAGGRHLDPAGRLS